MRTAAMLSSAHSAPACGCSRGPDINIHDVCGLYDRLITAPWAAEMRDAKIHKLYRTINVIFIVL